MLGRKLLSALLLSVFVAIAASISLCHTDDAVARDPYCPACNFQSSCVAIEIVEVSLLPDPAPAEVLNSEESFDYSALIIIGFPAFRLKGIYFVIGTLVLAEILRIIFDTVLPRANVLPSKLLNTYSLTPRYYLNLIIAVLAVGCVYWVSRSKFGLGLMSIRENEDAAEASGVNTQKRKLQALLASTFMSGLAGGTYAYYAAAAQPGYLFSAVWTFDAVIIVFVGGVGTILGPVIGSVFFVLLQQLLSLYLPAGTHVMVFGILFVLVVLFLPGGLIGLWKKFTRSHLRKTEGSH